MNIYLEIEQILSQILAFLVMLWVLKRFAWKPLLNVMEERRKKIETEFETIAEQKKDVARLLDEYHKKLEDIEAEARLKIQEEISKGRKIAQEMKEDATQQAKNLLEKSQLEIQREIGKAKIQLKNEIVNLVIASTQKMVQHELEQPNKQKQLVEEILEQTELK